MQLNPGLQQRLVGAIVLVALAVIFLPMLLDGSGAREQLDEAITIPEKPEPPASHLDPVEPSAPDAGTTEARATEPAASRADTQPATDAQGGGEGGDGAGPTAGAEKARGDADTASAAAGGAETVAEGWVVQVGSFRRETNAIVLRDRLRQEDFDADVERARADGRTVWRVLVGPVAERAKGESLKRRIEQMRGEPALLMTYP